MALMEWSDKYSVQIGEMDSQHKRLIGLINELNEAMRQGKGKDVLGKIIGELLNYTTTHFTAEERLMGQYRYPAESTQKNMHKLFIERINTFKKEFERGKITLSIDVLNFLSDWLINHIMIEDKKYGSFFKEKGLK